jgi:hypothetical protein
MLQIFARLCCESCLDPTTSERRLISGLLFEVGQWEVVTLAVLSQVLLAVWLLASQRRARVYAQCPCQRTQRRKRRDRY